MYWTVCNSNISYPAVNLCSGKSTSIIEIINLLEEITGHKLTVKINDGLFRTKDNDNVRGDNSLIKSMGFNYKYTLRDSLKWILNG
jgi:UDP-glucose 4-epimerase